MIAGQVGPDGRERRERGDGQEGRTDLANERVTEPDSDETRRHGLDGRLPGERVEVTRLEGICVDVWSKKHGDSHRSGVVK